MSGKKIKVPRDDAMCIWLSMELAVDALTGELDLGKRDRAAVGVELAQAMGLFRESWPIGMCDPGEMVA